ncbi:MAG: hypothetical protein JNM36_13010 [Chitinophagales bacterium]|nr:hypothetical protein [Chitinophagales bacterium]
MIFLQKYFPFNVRMYFIKGNIEELVSIFVNWLTNIEANSNKILTEHYHENLNVSIPRLLPFTTAEERRHIFVQLDDNWTFYLSNFMLGTDNSVPYFVSEQLKTSCLGIIYDTNSKFIELLSWSNVTRSFELERFVGYHTEISKTEFMSQGQALPFERTDLFVKRKIKERFTDESIIAFLEGMIIPINFSDDTIVRDTFFVYKKGKMWPSTKEYSWESALRNYYSK